jgi:hypothetical protein
MMDWYPMTPMTAGAISLRTVSLTLGALGLGGGLWALRFPETAKRFYRELPRNQRVGRILLLVDLVWVLWVFAPMRLGGWEWIKPIFLYASPLIYWFIITCVNQYLGARSVALFLILLAKPVVIVCFLYDTPLRLVLVTLAYLWVVMGICFVAAPHWMRDAVAFLEGRPGRWICGCWLKVVVSVVLIGLGFFAF